MTARRFFLASRHVDPQDPSPDTPELPDLETTLLVLRASLGRGRYVTLGGKGARPMIVRLGKWRWPATLLLLLFRSPSMAPGN